TVSQPSTTSAERRAARLVPKWRDVDLVRLRFEHVLNYRGTPAASHPLPCRPECARRRSKGQNLCSVRGCTLEDPGRSDKEPRDVLRHLPGDRAGRARPGLYREFPQDFFDLIIV